jgi:hypothetical protein
MAMKKTDSEGNPIVTMDAVKKAGFTNLRDYLNDKRGLKRRDGKAVKRTEEFMANKKAAAPSKDIFAPLQSPAVSANPAAAQKDTYDRVMRDETRKRDAAPPSRGNVERETGNKMRKIIEEQAEKERMSTYPKGSGMKKGGSVRGDGCAIRGKTKGTMR